MSPFYRNPPTSPFPIVESREENQRLQLFIQPPHQAESSLTCPIFSHTAQDQREPQHEEKVGKYIAEGGSGARQAFQSSPLRQTIDAGHEGHKLTMWNPEGGREGRRYNGPVKWMSSKMRLMQKLMNSSRSSTANNKLVKPEQDNSEINSTNSTIRVCSACNTTKTPLWRSGPQGPKSLCNACGIRQRKARRAAAAAAAAGPGICAALANDGSFVGRKGRKKEKRFKKQCKLPCRQNRGKKKLCFEELNLSLRKSSAFGRVFPQDEEEAAILLMTLSCGLVHG